MVRLVVESVASSSMLRKSLSPGNASEHGDFDGEVLEADEDTAESLINKYPNVRRADQPSNSGGSSTEDTLPTNEEGEPLCVGKDDGQCSRVVDEPNGLCWQHSRE